MVIPSFRRTFTGYPSPVSLAHEPDSAEPIWKTPRSVSKLVVPMCPRRENGHLWRFDRECSTGGCQADVCQACGLVRMTSYRTGQVVRCMTQFAIDVRLPLPATCPDCEAGRARPRGHRGCGATPRGPGDKAMTLRFIVGRILRELIELAERDADAEYDALDVGLPAGGPRR